MLRYMRSDLWKHRGGNFIPVTSRKDGDPNGARCTVCSLVLSYDAMKGNSHLHRHKRHHKHRDTVTLSQPY